MFPGFEIGDEDEVIEEINMNDYNLRSKGDPSASKSKFIPSPTIKNTTTTKSPTMLDNANLEYNIIYDMQKTWANISMYELTKLIQQRDLLLSHLNKMKGKTIAVSEKGKS